MLLIYPRSMSAATLLLCLWGGGGRDGCCCDWCVLSGRGLCDELITHPKKSCRMRCVVVCEQAIDRVGPQRHRTKNTVTCIKYEQHFCLYYPLSKMHLNLTIMSLEINKYQHHYRTKFISVTRNSNQTTFPPCHVDCLVLLSFLVIIL
jgi:hypothetical protein